MDLATLPATTRCAQLTAWSDEVLAEMPELRHIGDDSLAPVVAAIIDARHPGAGQHLLRLAAERRRERVSRDGLTSNVSLAFRLAPGGRLERIV